MYNSLKMKKDPKAPAEGGGGGLWASISNFFSGLFGKKPPPKTPIKGMGVRIKNVLKRHWRGLFGFLVPLCALSWQFEKDNNAKKVKILWLIMLWSFFLRPVPVAGTGVLPVFYLPMLGVISTVKVCTCYMNDGIVLFLLSGMIILLLNNSGSDRRLALKVMSSGDSLEHFSEQRMVFKCGISAFILSMISSRLIAASMITEYYTKCINNIENKFGKLKGEANYKEMRYVTNNAIQTCASIGSIGILHSSYSSLTFRAIFCESAGPDAEYPDIFNYLQYSAFAMPLSIVLFILNIAYHMLLVTKVGKKMSKPSMELMKKQIQDHKSQLPANISLHEKMTIFFVPVTLFFFFARWSAWTRGWVGFRLDKKSTPEQELPAIKDATVAAIFVVLLHTMPCSYNFLKYINAKKRKDLPAQKSESAVLWWKFVDKNLNYAYFFLIGSGVALINAVQKTGLDDSMSANLGTYITGYTWNVAILLVCIIAAIAANLLTGSVACVCFLPFVICMAPKAAEPWPTRFFLAALGVGVSSSFGFAIPYLYTPAYYCYHIGKLPVRKMIKYSFVPWIMCIICTWVALCFYAPILWGYDLKPLVAAPAAGGAAGGGGGDESGGGGGEGGEGA